jgi:subtilisin family serine protease
VQPGRKISDPVGHGTQMALVASGAVAPGGVPPELVDEGVPILAVRSFDDRGRATNYGLLRGIDYVVNEGGRVVSMSWGTETNSEFLKHAVMYAQDQGLIVVASAGNQPINRPLYPAAYRGVLAVSAITTDGEIWDQSNFGNFIFAAAPGTGSFPIGYNGPPGTYAGTSISSPFVARALTQYLTLHPVASNEQAVKALTDALTDAGELGRDDKYGHGSLDAEALKRYLQ